MTALLGGNELLLGYCKVTALLGGSELSPGYCKVLALPGGIEQSPATAECSQHRAPSRGKGAQQTLFF